MSKAIGLALILTGVGVGAYMMPSDIDLAPASPQASKATASPPSAGGSLAVVQDGTRVDQRPSAPAPKPQPALKPAAPPPPPLPPAEAASTRSAPVVIMLAQRTSEPAARVVVGQMQPSAATVDRGALARELQKELRRVGCYDGEINGAWTGPTRRAMKSFTDRVNATLPIEQPDYILLAMVQNHADKACGKSCPAGQALAGDGRCMPNAIIARKPAPPAPVVAAAPPIAKVDVPREKPAPVVSAWATTARVAVPAPSLPAPPLDGRMALSGPASQAVRSPPADRPRLAAVAPEAQPALAPVVTERRAAAKRHPARRAAARFTTSRGGWDSRYASAPRRQGFGPTSLFRSIDRLGL